MIRISLLVQVRSFGRCLASCSPAKHIMPGDECVPVTRAHEAKRKELQDLLEPVPEKTSISIIGELDEAIEVAGIPAEHQNRVLRIYKPAREATQSAWGNTKAWRVDLDARERWENPLMGWCSTGDPLSNVSMQLKFATKEDAINFCVKNGWSFEVEEAQKFRIKPKNYGENFAWNKRTRIGTK